MDSFSEFVQRGDDSIQNKQNRAKDGEAEAFSLSPPKPYEIAASYFAEPSDDKVEK